jgi:hypothetical protein
MIATIIGFVIILLGAAFEGVTHAILWSRKGMDAFKWNEHIVFVLQRLILGAALLIHSDLVGILCGALFFPLMHNGFYYYFRNKIDQTYPDGFWDFTKGSSANINFKPWHRIILAVIGLLGLIVWFVFGI